MIQEYLINTKYLPLAIKERKYILMFGYNHYVVLHGILKDSRFLCCLLVKKILRKLRLDYHQ